MRYLVYMEVPTEVGNRIDFEEGGPAKILGYVMERFAPEAVFTQACIPEDLCADLESGWVEFYWDNLVAYFS
ncbi:MAG: hypothetical protein WCE82_03420 [Halobacteriota archaeon]